MLKSNDEHGRRSLVRDAGQFRLGWRMWMWLLSLVNLVGPLFFLGRPEAWAVLGCYFIAAAVMIPLHRRLGWVRLLGVGHFQWFVLLPWLFSRIQANAPAGALGVWLWTLIAVDTVCLAIDIVDVLRYLAGDRAPLVPQNA